MPLTQTPAWQALAAERQRLGAFNLMGAFKANPGRFEAMQVQAAGLFMDYSKNLFEASTLELLCNLAAQQGVPGAREKMFKGEPINGSEGRAVLHTALRAANGDDVGGLQKAMALAQGELNRMATFAEAVRGGGWQTATGKPITDIIHVGIGGPANGPQLVTSALSTHSKMRTHFVTNVDGLELRQAFAVCDPAQSLLVIASKTFTTSETLQNARTVKDWLKQNLGDTWQRHVVAATANAQAAQEFGVPAGQVFATWDWVGGRFGVWGAAGITIALAHGIEAFKQFLAGARAMDQHFRTSELKANMPVLLALIGIWYRNFWGTIAHALLPYSERLRLLPAYFQQLEMESNGKAFTAGGKPIKYATSPVVFGVAGTTGQHSFYQMLHQGSDVVPVEFIGIRRDADSTPEQQLAMSSNLIGQSEALASNNRPSTMIVLPDLAPAHLGALLALYEHKVFVEGAIWGLNSFDQPGVELGKKLASTIAAELAGGQGAHDASTAGLIRLFR